MDELSKYKIALARLYHAINAGLEECSYMDGLTALGTVYMMLCRDTKMQQEEIDEHLLNISEHVKEIEDEGMYFDTVEEHIFLSDAGDINYITDRWN